MSTPDSSRSRSLVRSLLPLWILLAILAILSPIGLLAQGTAWGEWGSAELEEMLGVSQIPEGMRQLETIWNAPLPAYDIPGLGNATVGYIASAVIGIALIVLVTFVLGRTLARKDEADTDV